MIDIDLPAIVEFERPSGGEEAIAAAAELLSAAKFPVILNGAGVVLGGAIPASMALAERLDAPVCVGYQHNDAFPGQPSAVCGAFGIQRLEGGNGVDFRRRCGTVSGYPAEPVFNACRDTGWTIGRKAAKIIQVDINPDRIGLTKKVTVGIVGDAKKVAEAVLARLAPTAGEHGRARTQSQNRTDQIGLGAGIVLDGPRG